VSITASADGVKMKKLSWCCDRNNIATTSQQHRNNIATALQQNRNETVR
jgi:hypothetical protein